ncbi:MAG TPA: urate hydroxylase PuuD [Thermoanaerobaculia bacterium]|nr:urate hydroxylase PuuD [Thermoanaerobaculia bacterium]
MNYLIREWLNLALRWFHVFAGIMWIGQTYFFTWLDHTLNREGQVWMVHSGGFYIVDKQKTPKLLPKTLHWFKWEAALTFLSGFLLLILVYYTGGLMVDDSIRKLDPNVAIAISVGLIIVGWIVYDLLWVSPVGRNEVVGTVISYVLLVGLIYGVTRVFAARAAYFQVGAMLGTLMAANVWVRILPAQRALIAAAKEGKEPDMRLADIAKQRSKQNTFMIMPVVFIMLSNHFPVATYGHEYNWLILAGLVLVGWGAAKIIREH